MKFLLPALELNGFSGVYQMKSGKVKEGEALFYRTSKFKSVVLFLKSLVQLKSDIKKIHRVLFDYSIVEHIHLTK